MDKYTHPTPTVDQAEDVFVAYEAGFGEDDACRSAFRLMIQKVRAEAWNEGANYAWATSGEGWNGEYPQEGVPFTDTFEDSGNPYEAEGANG